MRAKGRHYRIKQSANPTLEHHLVIYPLSFAAFRPCEISEQPAQYSNLHRCSRIRVPRPSAVYASLLRMMLRYPASSSACESFVLLADISQLVLYHLMGYTLETISGDDEEDENRRVAAALETIREWGMRKEWGPGEEWMEKSLSDFVRGSHDVYFPPERRASP
jgi:hypothetical protein